MIFDPAQFILALIAAGGPTLLIVQYLKFLLPGMTPNTTRLLSLTVAVVFAFVLNLGTLGNADQWTQLINVVIGLLGGLSASGAKDLWTGHAENVAKAQARQVMHMARQLDAFALEGSGAPNPFLDDRDVQP